MLGDIAKTVGGILLVVLIISLVLGQAFGQPVLLSYVETDSMEPTIDTGDGFLVVPAELSSEPQVGDVIIFDAETIEGGGLTTHRIVDETEEGFITRGDANPFSDQDGGEPPVTEDQIVGNAIQVGDNPIVVPYLGTVIETIQGAILAVLTAVLGVFGFQQTATEDTVGIGLFGLGLVLLLFSFGFDLRGRSRTRERRRVTASTDVLDTRLLVLILLAIVLIPANAAMVAGADTTELVIEGEDIEEVEDVEPGDPVDAEIDIRNNGLIAVLTILEPLEGNVTMEPQHLSVPSGGSGTATATVPAPEHDEETAVVIDERRYLLILPEELLIAADQHNPLLAFGVLNLFIGGAIVGLVGGIFGFGTQRLRDNSRGVPLLTRIRQRLF